MKIAHLSDIHFGRITHTRVLDALVDDVEREGVDLVAVSGDLTQRALHAQFRDAAAFMKRFSAPQIIVPGNHDVFPWWRPLARIFRPVARFKSYFGDKLIRTFEMPGLAFLGINSAHGLTIKGGKISSAAADALSSFFEKQPAHVFKILMLHHHLTPLEALRPHDVSRLGAGTYQKAIDAGVDLILCGHMHVSHVGVSHVETPEGKDKTPVIASAGTATSDRGRRTNKKRNFYNLIEIQSDHFTVEERSYLIDQSRFITENSSRFERN